MNNIISINTNREKFLIYSLIPIIVFFISHIFLNDFLTQKNSELFEQKKILLSQLEIKKEYLGTVVDTKLNQVIKKYSNNILFLEKEIKQIHNIKNKLLENMNYLNSQSLKWVELVEFLVKDSNSKTIELFSIKNLELENNINGNNEKLNIQISGSGNFKNIYSFINSIEQFNAMLIIDNVSISKDKTKDIEFKFNIKIWEFLL
jgi:hypothetical protein